MINPTIQQMMTTRKKRRVKFIGTTLLLASIVLLLCAAMMMLGNTIYPVQEIIRVLMGDVIPGSSFAINEIRLPRMLAGLFAGFSFGVGGYIFQTMLRNPLANPDVIGVTTGSSAAAVCWLSNSAHYLCIIKTKRVRNRPSHFNWYRHSSHA